MNAKQAISTLKPDVWANTDVKQRLIILKKMQKLLLEHEEEFTLADNKTKAITKSKENMHEYQSGIMTVIMPFGTLLAATIDVYETLRKTGKMPKPKGISKVKEGLYDVKVSHYTLFDRIMYSDRTDYVRVKDEVRQTNPYDNKPGIIAILGAGNFSSEIEDIYALFYDNKVVAHKPHRIHKETDKVWEKVYKPLIDINAVAFVDSKQGSELTKDKRVDKVYFTGSTNVARIIEQNTNAELVSECGGNNPLLIVPGEWTKKEIKHHAEVLATMIKMNGGHVCGRTQSIIVSKHWKQLDDFITLFMEAVRVKTPAITSFYPNHNEVFGDFEKAYPNAVVISPENGRLDRGRVMIVENDNLDSYSLENEAFNQIAVFQKLDVSPNPKQFLVEAVEFANTKLLGTLAAMILIDPRTQKKYQKDVEEAVTELKYGAIGVNVYPPFIWTNPYQTWGGNEVGEELVSGHGDFGNALNLENVEKSISYCNFVSQGHFKQTNKKTWQGIAKNATLFSARPTWLGLTKVMGTMISDRFRSKDF